MRLSIPPSFLPTYSSEPSFIAWSRHGLPCFIRRQSDSLHLCGYVGVPSTHPWFTSHHDDLPPNIHAAAHGGLTYTGVQDGFTFFGFDCAHSGDLCPGHVTSSGTYRDLAYVTAKVNALADALAGAETHITSETLQSCIDLADARGWTTTATALRQHLESLP
jgi:hypothetical protein